MARQTHDEHVDDAGEQVPEDSTYDLQQRLDALHALAQTQVGPTAPAPAQPPTRLAMGLGRRRSRLVIGASALALIALVVGLVAALQGRVATGPSSGSKRTQTITFTPGVPGLGTLGCPHDAAWSPDGTRTAIVGYLKSCFMPPPTGNPFDTNLNPGPHALIAIYDTSSGKLIAQLHPDEAILPHISLPSDVAAVLSNSHLNSGPLIGFNYTHVLWSPDGQRLAVTFSTFVPSGLPPNGSSDWPGTMVDGVLLTDLAGGNVRVLLHPFDAAHPTYTEWDLGSGAAMPVPSTLKAPSSFATLAPAPSDSWGAGGALQPVSPLSSAGSASASATLPSGPIGTPDGGAEFSIWQPGTASPLPPVSASPQAGPAAWIVDIAAWSPDGRYLVERATLEGPIQQPGQGGAPSGSWSQAPGVPPRDAGFAAVIASSLGADLSENAYYAVAVPLIYGKPVAWRPDGRVVVTYSRADRAVTLYDCATGAQLARLSTGGTSQTTDTEASMLRWSGDGSRLLLFDPTLNTITIWGAGSLPK